MTAEFDASVQFGGKDAAQAVLSHFRALKAVARTTQLRGFPCRKLAFILRVDGEINEYGISGVIAERYAKSTLASHCNSSNASISDETRESHEKKVTAAFLEVIRVMQAAERNP